MLSHFVSLLVFLTCIIPLINAQYTLDPCRCDAECDGGRVCVFLDPDQPLSVELCSPGTKGCVCAVSADINGIEPCEFDSDCRIGDVCVTFEAPEFSVSNCVSECGTNRENCSESPEKPECDLKPTVTPIPSKSPRPSSTPMFSELPNISTTVGPPAPKPSEQPIEIPEEMPEGTLEGSPSMESLESLEPSLTPEATRRPKRSRRPTPTPSPSEGIRTGLTRDTCMLTSECKPPRRCYIEDSELPCDDLSRCECIPPTPTRCETDDDCEEGEQCYEGSDTCVSTCYFYKKNNPDVYVTKCNPKGFEPKPLPSIEVVSPEPTPTPIDIIPVCVAAEELEGVEKVFERDFHAWVLCDAGGSCATPGHMIMWNGEAMMMRSYCDVVGCEKKVMAVNSPKWTAGVVQAKTNGVVYTSFAARYETRAEEKVLAAVVRLVV